MKLILLSTLLWALSSSESTDSTSNGLSCFFCDPDGDCSGILLCEGVEDMCFSGIVLNDSSNTALAGCVSQSICDAVSDVANRPFLQNFGSFISGPICCEGIGCNAVTTTVTPISAISSTNMTSIAPTPNTEVSTVIVYSRDVEESGGVAGCVSQSICDAKSEITERLFLQNIGSFISGPTCCEGIGCNSMTTTTTVTSPEPITPPITPTLNSTDQHLGLRIRIAAFQGISNTTLIEAVRKYLQVNVLNGTDHMVNVISITEDGSTS